MLEQQYDYYRKEISTLIFYALGIVVAFAVTFTLNHADGKHILTTDWMTRPHDRWLAAFYVFIFICAWIFYFISLITLDREMTIIRGHLLSIGAITNEERYLLERSKKWKLRIGVFLLACFLLWGVFLDTGPAQGPLSSLIKSL